MRVLVRPRCPAAVASPSLAGPQDAWTVDPGASSLAFSVEQVGTIVSGRFPTWTGRSCSIPPRSPPRASTSGWTCAPVTTNNRDVDYCC